MASKYHGLSKSELERIAQATDKNLYPDEYKKVIRELSVLRIRDGIKQPTKRDSLVIFAIFFVLSIYCVHIGNIPMWVEPIYMDENPIWFWFTLILINGIALGRLYWTCKKSSHSS